MQKYYYNKLNLELLVSEAIHEHLQKYHAHCIVKIIKYSIICAKYYIKIMKQKDPLKVYYNVLKTYILKKIIYDFRLLKTL